MQMLMMMHHFQSPLQRPARYYRDKNNFNSIDNNELSFLSTFNYYEIELSTDAVQPSPKRKYISIDVAQH